MKVNLKILFIVLSRAGRKNLRLQQKMPAQFLM